MRTLTAYGIGVVSVLAVLNGIAWQAAMRRENVQKSYLIHVAGYNLGLIMRLLTGAGTPQEFRVWASAWLFATSDADRALVVMIFAVTDDRFAVFAVTIRPNSGG